MTLARRHTSHQKPLLLPVVVWAVALLATTPPARADELYEAATQLQSRTAAEVEQLAQWCREEGLSAQAEQTRRLLGPRDPYKLYLPVLKETVGREPLPADASASLVEWDARLTRLRRDRSNALYDLARTAIHRRRPSLAYDLVLAAIRINPDHEAVRRVLGYQEYRGQWHTAYEVRRLRAGQVWHEKFGWLPRTHVGRYEQGRRSTGRKWITAEEDARLHQDIESGWLVESEHYEIVTNHSLEAGVALSEKLECLYRIWRQLFIRYYASEAQVVALFDGQAHSRQNRMPTFQVVYFRDRDDYNRSLRPAMGNIEISIGVYIESMRRAYFFADKNADDRTLYHEATHQLFHQSRPVARGVGYRANFWIVEGIAMYMESLRREGDYYVLGGFDDQRIYAARYRLLKDDFYVPLGELVTYGMEKIQKDPRIATLYSQAAGLTSFLVHYDSGRYRDALVAYLTTVYTGRDDPGTLATLTGTPYAQLDAQYRQFMQQSLSQAEPAGP
ncbi:MAG: hypothetical protein JXB62_17250 [Pirellulales bacterium]|nr:hypothetical protein [Pirellulales bacterium]